MSDERIRAYGNDMDCAEAMFFGIVINGVPRGLVELRRESGSAEPLELAVSVETAWRGHGHGGALVQYALKEASSRGERTVVAVVNSANQDMRAVLHKTRAATLIVNGEIHATWYPGNTSF